MIKKISLGLLVLVLSTSCVSKKIYQDLENKFADLKKENRKLADDNEELNKVKNQPIFLFVKPTKIFIYAYLYLYICIIYCLYYKLIIYI